MRKRCRNAPKIICSERIVNARIAEVWFGIENPNPTIDHEGINYLLDNGVKVFQFDPDLHKEIEDFNKKCLKWANLKKEAAMKEKPKPVKKINQIALKSNASSIILAHNHPSGNEKPSEADKRLTSKIHSAGLLLEISVLDHIILTADSFYSFADEGLLSP